MKFQIYPNPLLDLREIDWENNKESIKENIVMFGQFYSLESDEFTISNIQEFDNINFIEISIKQTKTKL